MGQIIEFNRKNNDKKITEIKFWKKGKRILEVIVAICGITGLSVITIIGYFDKDWQAIAEQYNNEGLELYDLGEYYEAIELYDQAIALEDKGIDNIDVCYFNRGMAYYRLEDYQKAIGDFTIAIEIESNSKYYVNRANAYEKLGDYANAALDNMRAIEHSLE